MVYSGPWEVVPLYRTMTGHKATAGDASVVTLDFEGTDLLVFVWSHPWSGYAFVEVDGVCPEPVNLYSTQGGFRRLHLSGLAPGRHRLRITGSWHRDHRSHSNELIFYEAIGYTRLGDEGRSMSSNGTGAALDHLVAVRPSRFGVVYTAPETLTAPERVLLYSLVFGVQPRRCLEIGTHGGGAALIIVAALDDIGAGRLACVDPQPAVAPEHWVQVSHRATILAGPSPEVLPQVVDAVGGPVDFALVHGAADRQRVVRDVEGLLAVLAPKAYLLFRDARDAEVAHAIDDLLCKYADRLCDCGMLSVGQGAENTAGGLRLVRHFLPEA